MIVRTLSAVKQSARRIVSPDGNWESARMSLKDDGMGFSFHITTIYAGADFYMHYQNHLEAVYCIEGRGEVENLADGAKHVIEPGTLYLLDQHDRHRLRAEQQLTLACVFNPPLSGKEVHNSEGAYELEAEAVTDAE
ncbi:MAG: ectoine synthase [Methylococcales bacterium]|nr:ectoine synthase [Methylococcales bacterium]